MTHNLRIYRGINFYKLFAIALAVALVLSIVTTPVAQAAVTVFVRPDGSDTLCNGTVNVSAASAPNCAFATIQRGVNSVDPGGAVNVAAGTYNENVSISKALTLRGANAGLDARFPRGTESVVDAGLVSAAFAVNASNVTIDGFKVQRGQNGLNSGIWMGGANKVQILNNVIMDNAIGLFVTGGPATIRYNRFENNNRLGTSAGGTGLYSDLSNALVIDANYFLSHTQNVAVIFGAVSAPAHTNLTFTNNFLAANRQGVHAIGVSGGSFQFNVYQTNTYGLIFDGGNNGITVRQNNFASNTTGILTANFYSIGANANVNVNFNRFVNNTPAVNASSAYSGVLNAENNWWGCNVGPGGVGCNTVGSNVDFNPWLTLKITAAPSSIFVGGTSNLTADLTINSNGVDTSPSGAILDGTPITFTGTLGTISPATGYTSGGKAQSIYTAGAVPATGSTSATLDNQTVATTITINPKLNSTTSVASSANPSVVGQVVTFTATASAVSPGALIPSGTITFKEGTVTLGTATLNGSGQAALSTAQLSVGEHAITAFYSGNGAFNPSNSTAAPLLQTVTKANTTIDITSDTPDPSQPGQTVTVSFSVAVNAPGSGTPTGLVTISAGGENCTGTIATGRCSLTLNSPGHITLTAIYAGDANFNGSSGTDPHEVVDYKVYLPLIQK